MPSLAEVSPASLARVLDQLRTADGTDVHPWSVWSSIEAEDRPALFRLLDIGADMPRLGTNQTIANLPAKQWPALAAVGADLIRIQHLVDHPVIVADSIPVESLSAIQPARTQLDDHHCVTMRGFLDADARAVVEAQVAALAEKRGGTWGQLTRDDSPPLFAAIEQGLASDGFRGLTDFDLARDEYSLTLSLQAVEPAGIAWHRDLYWPREWVGRDVFAVFYALEDDGPDKGGAFTYYLPWHNTVHHFYRRRHEATVLWNSADQDGRILHAVTAYQGPNTRRHLLILQCLRRTG